MTSDRRFRFLRSALRAVRAIVVDVENLTRRSAFSIVGRDGDHRHVVARLVSTVHFALPRETPDVPVVVVVGNGSWRRRELGIASTVHEGRVMDAIRIAADATAAFVDFVRTSTEAGVLCVDGAEADDLAIVTADVAGGPVLAISDDNDWLQILSSAPGIVFRPRDACWVLREGVVNADGETVPARIDGRGRLVVGTDLSGDLPERWWRYAVFLKCLRGRPDYGLPPAIPRVRTTKIRKAWDRSGQDPWGVISLLSEEAPLGGDALDQWKRNRRYLDPVFVPEPLRESVLSALVDEIVRPRARIDVSVAEEGTRV